MDGRGTDITLTEPNEEPSYRHSIKGGNVRDFHLETVQPKPVGSDGRLGAPP